MGPGWRAGERSVGPWWQPCSFDIRAVMRPSPGRLVFLHVAGDWPLDQCPWAHSRPLGGQKRKRATHERPVPHHSRRGASPVGLAPRPVSRGRRAITPSLGERGGRMAGRHPALPGKLKPAPVGQLCGPPCRAQLVEPLVQRRRRCPGDQRASAGTPNASMPSGVGHVVVMTSPSANPKIEVDAGEDECTEVFDRSDVSSQRRRAQITRILFEDRVQRPRRPPFICRPAQAYPADPCHRMACASEANSGAPAAVLSLIAGRQENWYTAGNQNRGHLLARLTIEADVENPPSRTSSVQLRAQVPDAQTGQRLPPLAREGCPRLPWL